MSEINIEKHFASQVDDYIELMQKLVPNYIAGQKFLCELIECDINKSIKVLDLGCGNGVLSEIVLKKFPNAHVVGFDLTSEMLKSYQIRLEKFQNRFEIIQGNFITDDFRSDYDIVLTGLTLHHLNSEQRKEIFKKIYNSLNSNGIYITRDIIIEDNDEDRKKLYQKWINFMNSKGENGLSWFEKHIQKDFPETIKNLKEWLVNVGFKNVECYNQDINFLIIRGIK